MVAGIGREAFTVEGVAAEEVEFTDAAGNGARVVVVAAALAPLSELDDAAARFCFACF